MLVYLGPLLTSSCSSCLHRFSFIFSNCRTDPTSKRTSFFLVTDAEAEGKVGETWNSSKTVLLPFSLTWYHYAGDCNAMVTILEIPHFRGAKTWVAGTHCYPEIFLCSSKIFWAYNMINFGFFLIISHFPDSSKTTQIYPDLFSFSCQFHNCPDFSGLNLILWPVSKPSGLFADHFPNNSIQRAQVVRCKSFTNFFLFLM